MDGITGFILKTLVLLLVAFVGGSYAGQAFKHHANGDHSKCGYSVMWVIVAAAFIFKTIL